MGYSGCTSIVDLEFGSLFLYNMNKQGPVDYECKTRKQTYTGLIGGTILRQAEIFLESGFLALVSHLSTCTVVCTLCEGRLLNYSLASNYLTVL